MPPHLTQRARGAYARRLRKQNPRTIKATDRRVRRRHDPLRKRAYGPIPTESAHPVNGPWENSMNLPSDFIH